MIDIIYSILRGLTGLVGLDHSFINMWEAIRDFLELGGDVLLFIGLLLVVMWISRRNINRSCKKPWTSGMPEKSENPGMRTKSGKL